MIYVKWLALCLLDWVLLLTVPVAAPTPAALQEQQNIAARATARAQIIE